MHTTVCDWCNALIRIKHQPAEDELSVCDNDVCGKNAVSFRIHFSDHNIGLQYETQFGINPNHRGKKCDSLKRPSKKESKEKP